MAALAISWGIEYYLCAHLKLTTNHSACHRRKDIDQIQDELMEEEEKGEETVFDVDDDLPGQGQFYCTPCARHFTDQQTKTVHIKSKLHKRR